MIRILSIVALCLYGHFCDCRPGTFNLLSDNSGGIRTMSSFGVDDIGDYGDTIDDLRVDQADNDLNYGISPVQSVRFNSGGGSSFSGYGIGGSGIVRNDLILRNGMYGGGLSRAGSGLNVGVGGYDSGLTRFGGIGYGGDLSRAGSGLNVGFGRCDNSPTRTIGFGYGGGLSRFGQSSTTDNSNIPNVLFGTNSGASFQNGLTRSGGGIIGNNYGSGSGLSRSVSVVGNEGYGGGGITRSAGMINSNSIGGMDNYVNTLSRSNNIIHSGFENDLTRSGNTININRGYGSGLTRSGGSSIIGGVRYGGSLTGFSSGNRGGVVSGVYGSNINTFGSGFLRAGGGLIGGSSNYGDGMTRSSTNIGVGNYGSGLTKFTENNNNGILSGNTGFDSDTTRSVISAGGLNAGNGNGQSRFDNFDNRGLIGNIASYGSGLTRASGGINGGAIYGGATDTNVLSRFGENRFGSSENLGNFNNNNPTRSFSNKNVAASNGGNSYNGGTSDMGTINRNMNLGVGTYGNSLPSITSTNTRFVNSNLPQLNNQLNSISSNGGSLSNNYNPVQRSSINGLNPSSNEQQNAGSIGQNKDTKGSKLSNTGTASNTMSLSKFPLS